MSATRRPTSRVRPPARTISPARSCPAANRRRTGQRISAAQPDPDPGQQLGQRERLGQVVLRAVLQAVHLGRHVGQAGQHQHGLVGVRGQHALQDGLARHVGHDQIQDDQVVVAGQSALQRLGAGGREVGQVTRGGQRAADERADARLVVGHQDPGGDGVGRLGEGGLGRFLRSHRLFAARGRMPLACPPRHQAQAPGTRGPGPQSPLVTCCRCFYAGPRPVKGQARICYRSVSQTIATGSNVR